MVLNRLTSKYISKKILEDGRLDNRKLDEYRVLDIKKNEISNALGSCRLKLGNTEVVCGIKADLATPYSDSPNEGVIVTSVEYMPLAAKEIEGGRPDETMVETSRVVDRGIRESHCIDMKKLCVTEGEEVWRVCIDCYVMGHDGNLIDACALASALALTWSTMPKKDEKEKDKPFPINDFPIAITARKYKTKIVLDTTKDEEKCFESRLTTTFTKDGNICAMQKGECGGFSVDEFNTILDLSSKKQKELRKKAGV
ncbi:MAG: exosome complex protein Rrp42 [Candidatus Aenigmarchaeota archaeon]|nr:exosome complex protein Rrp42 [Candidatus Aenigmarchaeota archaeon]